MRFVSVVVPDCEIATTIVSLMSAVSSNPDSSVAVSASIVIGRAPSASRNTRAKLWPATCALPCPITSTRRMGPGAQPVEDRRRQRLGREPHVEPAVAFDDAAAQVLRNEAGASAISLRR